MVAFDLDGFAIQQSGAFRRRLWPFTSDQPYNLCLARNQPLTMTFKLKDRVRRIGKQEVCTVEDIREPDEHILGLNPTAETMYWIQRDDDITSRVLAKESELEPAE